ncbi:tail assembly protein [Escherichia coli]|nr:tail assembly protein [Escherichia coli]
MSKQGEYSEKCNDNYVCVCHNFYLCRDLQRFGRRLSLYVNSMKPIRALSLQVPGFRRQMNEGWYQIRIHGDTGGGVRPSSRTSG